MKIIRTAAVVNRHSFFHQKLASRSLAKTINHMLGGGQWAIIAGQQGLNNFNPDGTKNPSGVLDNRQKHKSLKQAIRDAGYGFIDNQIGLWLNQELKAVGGQPVKVPEDSLFIPDMDQQTAMQIGQQFGQEQVIVGSGGTFSFVDCKSGAVAWGPNSVKDYFEYIGEDHPSFDANHTNSGGDKWRFAPPEEHQRNVLPPVGDAAVSDPLAQPAARTAMRIVRQSPTHYYYYFLAPMVRGRSNEGIVVASDRNEGNGFADFNADALAAWLPLIRG